MLSSLALIGPAARVADAQMEPWPAAGKEAVESDAGRIAALVRSVTLNGPLLVCMGSCLPQSECITISYAKAADCGPGYQYMELNTGPCVLVSIVLNCYVLSCMY